MKTIVFGASGGVGTHLVRIAADRGHQVTAVSRREIAVPSGVRLAVADVLDARSFDLVAGHDLVLSSLGLRRTNPANPWSALASPPDFCSRTATALIAAMQRHRIGRVVAVSAAGVAESHARMNGLMKFFVATSNVGVGYRDLAAMEDLFARSELDWCCPRPTRLTDGRQNERIATVDAFPMRAAISRADVAWWMVTRAEAGALQPRTPQITAAP
jgi:putative NADH-flavin reductase